MNGVQPSPPSAQAQPPPAPLDLLADAPVSVGVPSPPSADAAPATAQAGQPGSAAAPQRPWRWRLHLLSPTTEMDVGQATYATAYPRLLSLEYLFCTTIAVAMCAHGFAIMSSLCKHMALQYLPELDKKPDFLTRHYGSVGYDDNNDQQWVGFVVQYPKFFSVALLLGVVTWLAHRLSSQTARSDPSSAAQSSSSISSTLLHSTVEEEHIPIKRENKYTVFAGTRKWRVCARTCVSPSLLRSAVHRLLGQKWVLPLFYSIVGLIFFAVVHGPHFFLPLLLILANYLVFSRLQRWCPYRIFMTIMWATHLGLLYLVEMYRGFEEVYWLQYYFPTSIVSTSKVLGAIHARPGLWRQRMRWYVAFRMTTLRLIAFNYDLWEATHSAARARQRATDKHDTACVECAQLREQNSASASANAAAGAAPLPAEASRCYKYRTEHARDLADYSLVNYLAYVAFPPLYLAGPMSSFNAFVSYMRVPSTAMPLRKMAVYALRILGIYATEYVLLHYVHVTALGRHPKLILKMTLKEQAFYLFFTLAYLWVKFSFIWKSSRLFAMLSGIEVPEDMRRCFSNTFSVRDFWRDWHASFNLWIVRYMYIPMGGRARVALSILPIFLFIALWHDPALHLVKWALCIAAMFVVELVVSACFGWVVGVFRREMADAGADVAAGAVEDGRTSPSSARGVAAALLRPAARFTVRHLSPRVRAWCYRMLRVLGGMSTVFGLIVANLIGFSMQNSSAATFKKVGGATADTEADRVIARALRSITVTLGVGIVCLIFSGSSLAVMDRDLVAHQMRWFKGKYGLK